MVDAKTIKEIKKLLTISFRDCRKKYINDINTSLNDYELENIPFKKYKNRLEVLDTIKKINSDDDYVKLDSDGDLKSYSNLQLALKDNFIGNELIDFAMEHKDIHIDDLYDEYIHDTIESAQQTMSDEEYESALKEYTTDEMIEKYPEVNGIINRILDKEVSDEKDLKKSKDIND